VLNIPVLSTWQLNGVAPMDMKIDSERIKSLRLQKSWTQEKLAEKAGLNPRTVQRAESEGSASLKTRLQLAHALDLTPDQLDSRESKKLIIEKQPRLTLLADSRKHLANTGIGNIILMLVITCIYLASKPVFDSMSLFSFSWKNFNLRYESLWWAMTISHWMLLFLPLIIFSFYKNKQNILKNILLSGFVLLLAAIRYWQPELVANTLTAGMYYSGLLLLLSLYLPTVNNHLIKTSVQFFLAAYVFIWFFQGIGHFNIFMSVNNNFLTDMPTWSRYFRAVQRELSNMMQLIPVLMVLLLALKREDMFPNSKAAASTQNPGEKSEKNSENFYRYVLRKGV